MSTANSKGKKRSGDSMDNASGPSSSNNNFPNPKKTKIQQEKNSGTKETDKKNAKSLNILSEVKAFILTAGIEKARLQIFKSNLVKYGGKICDEIDSDTNYIIVDDKHDPEKVCRLLKLDQPFEDSKKIVRTSWLSQCFRHKKLIDVADYCVDLSKVFEQSGGDVTTDADVASEHADEVSKCERDVAEMKPDYPKVGHMWRAAQKPQNVIKNESDYDSDYEASSDEESTHADATDVHDMTGKNLPVGNWICAQSSKNPKPNFNKRVTDKLEAMVKAYESTNDKWRAFGYQKAVQALRKYPKEITTWEEAKALPSVGSKLADKIWEIIESGELRKLNELKCNEDVRVLELFTDVWGAGPTTARAWYQQGFRTLDDLKTKANLTHQQKVGLAHYHDFLERMPREEAGAIERMVRQAAESLVDGVIAQACGSYRRGKSTCGDVDVLVTHPDGKSHRGLFAKLLAKLKEDGFLTDDLVTAEESGNQKKYLGVCRLKGENQKYRRLDIIVVPYDEYACALVYFTGSAHLNRSLRHLAKKMGMSLSEHSLNTGVVRKGGEKIYEGTPLPTPTEESVFTQLGVPYRPPEERDH